MGKIMKIINVPYIDQTGGGAFTGCESVTAVMLLNFLGYDLSIYDFIDKFLDKEPFEMRDGVLCGPDPYEAFAGNPYDAEAMGCYAPVIKNSLEKIIGEEYEVIDESGGELPALCEKYIDRGMPLIVWATIDLKDIVVGPVWKLRKNGQDFTWLSNEHCMLLVGYDDENYIFNDPWNNNGIIAYDKNTVIDRYEKQHSQAIGLIKKYPD